MVRSTGRVLIAAALIYLAAAWPLRAQCADGPPHNLCEDSCCHTDVLLLNTGYDHAANAIYPIGSQDNYWTVVADGAATRLVPRPADVIPQVAIWSTTFANSQWINGNGGPLDPLKVKVTYQKCFCVCGPDSTDLTFTMNILADNDAVVFLDAAVVGTVPAPGYNTPTTLVFTTRVAPGRHCIDVQVNNDDGGFSGLDIQGTVQGTGLLKYNCCAGPPIPHDDCDTNHLVIGTDSTWTLVSGPDPGTHPRCADNIPSPYPGTWAPVIPGTQWIGANPTGTSRPGCVPGDMYTYRKSFCVAEAGTFIITITGSADDSGVVDLNGVTLSPAGVLFNYATNTTQTYIVALEPGCNCIDIRVFDLGCGITGLDALVDIQGGHLLKPQCCRCPDCNNSQPRTHAGEHGGIAGTVIHSLNDPAAEARPMLVSVPNPATGETTVHYVIDGEADTHLELFNAAGERVLVVDEGVRARGAHVVPITTRSLPSGAYRLQLTYGTHRLSTPLNVQK
ncbi:MAG TPA: hypothetical protein VHI13_04490 [Candidatus Kapabacteria bacterium]|nr:hypothetical protein [Candidatus Kapabacteria bacterium]